MNMKRKGLLWVLAILALLLAGAAVGVICHHITNHCGPNAIGTSDYGVLISILGLLIAFVVGFQIYNAIEAKDSLKEIGELKNVKKELDTFKYEIQSEINDSIGFVMDELGFNFLALCYHLEGIYFALIVRNEDLLDANLHNANRIMEKWDSEKSEKQFNSGITERDKDLEHRASELITKINSEFSHLRLFNKYRERFLVVVNKLENERTNHKGEKKQK